MSISPPKSRCQNRQRCSYRVGLLTIALLALVVGCGRTTDGNVPQDDTDKAPAGKAVPSIGDKTTSSEEQVPFQKPQALPEPTTFEGLLDQREQLDNTVWAKERLAQRYEQAIVHAITGARDDSVAVLRREIE